MIFKENPFQPVPNVTLYQSLYTHMREAILSGELKGGMKLPSTRALANELNLSRNTVLNAYRQLLTEGYLEGRAGSGTFVAHVLPETLLTAPRRFDTVSERRTVSTSLCGELRNTPLDGNPGRTFEKINFNMRRIIIIRAAVHHFPAFFAMLV